MINRSTTRTTSWPAALLVASLAMTGAACSGQGPNAMTGPSSIGGTQARPTVQAANDDTAVAYLNPVDLSVTIQTTTTSSDPVNGKIHLQILVDAAGNALPCDAAGGIWVRFDGSNGGIDVVGGQTTHTEDFGNIESRNIPIAESSSVIVQNVSCGQPFCIRAQYVAGSGPPPKAGTHHSDTDFNPLDAPYTFACPSCTYTQGFWGTHGPVPTGNNSNEWPVTSLTLGTVNYTDLQLQSILDAPVAGNGLISLAHQLIAAKLNIANGTPDSAVAAAIAAADALIGGLVIPPVGSGYLAPADTSALTGTLGSYNEGVIGPGHCGS